ncbi:MAG: superoxide dismutase family protein, partial [bacterium]
MHFNVDYLDSTHMTRQLHRTVRVSLAVVAFGAVSACHARSAPVADNALRATAFLLDSLGKEVGNVRLTETPGTPGITIAIEIARGATTGQHGIHLHTVGKCDAAGVFASAGGHFNPSGKKHGLFSPEGPHAG